MPATKRSTGLSTVIAIMAMLGMTGCQDEAPTDPTVTGIALAKGGGGGKGPKVESTDPTQAPQDTTLDVQVFGSSFDDGSSVTFTLDGTPSDSVRTNTTTFVSDKQLTANITIDLNAITDLYDLEVLSSRGRKGIGADLFSVTKKGKPGGDPDVTITQTDLGTLEGSSSARAYSVASGPDGNSVRVVGGSGGSPFFWTANGGMVKLTVPEDASASAVHSSAVGINAEGQIIGSRITDRGFQAIFWSSSSAESIDLTAPAQPGVLEAYAINNNGQVVGRSFNRPDGPNPWPNRAMLWTVDAAGTVTTRDLQKDTFSALGFPESEARDINDGGQVVGWVNGMGNPNTRAFLLDNGTVTVLDEDNESYAYGVNDAEEVQIAGVRRDPSTGEYHPVVWTVTSDGTIRRDVMPPLPGFDGAALWDGGFITDAGRIVGRSFQDGPSGPRGLHATLWTINPLGPNTRFAGP